jgi:uncharacterized delta-60 repeat protein
MNGRRHGAGVAVVALSLVLLATGAATAGAGGADPSFGNRGVAMPSLPDALARSHFGLVAAASGGRLLVTDVYESDRSEYHTAIERRGADGSLDPSFADEGSVGVAGFVDVLAEDPAGGVVYSGSAGLGRLEPDGSRDKAFDIRARYGSANSIAFDSQGRIVAVRNNPPGPRYHPHEGELEVLRFEPDGRPDLTFGANGVVYLGQAEEVSSEIGLLPDGSIVVAGSRLDHLAADGTVLPSFEEPTDEGRSTSLALFPDGTFAVSRSSYGKPGCTITRYQPDGSVDQGFAPRVVFSEGGRTECALAVAPEGGLLIGEVSEPGHGKTSSRLLLLTAAGAPAPGFGDGGSVHVSAPKQAVGGAPLTIEDAAFASDGRIVVGGGGEDAVLIGLGSNGGVDPSFGQRGTVAQRASLPSWTKPRAIAAEADGELLVTGITDSGSVEERPFWMRLTADGKLIPTSSGEPFASVPLLATHLRPVGSRYLYALVEKGKDGTYVAKFERDGALVKGFGRRGIVPLPHGFESTSLVVDPDGGVIAVGRLGFARMAAYRLTAAGRAAAGFGRRGLATVRFPGASETRADTGALLPGGDIVLAGLADERLAVAELGPDGRLHRGFGSGGFFTCSCGGARPWTVDVVGHRGHIYVLDHWKGPRIGEGNSLVKVSAAGRLDRTFAGHGYRAVRVGSPITLFARAGRLMVVGQKSLTSGPAQVREFRLDGSATRSYGGGDRALVAGGSGFTARLSAALQPGGRLVVAGEPRAKREFDGSRLELLGLR